MTPQTLGPFETARLTVEPLRPHHLDFLCALHSDPRVAATLGGVLTRQETERRLRKNLDRWQEHGFGLWVLFEKATARPVGRAGLLWYELEGVQEIELTYALVADAWGKGYATEAGRALVDIAFRRLSAPRVIAFTLPDNVASRRVMEKCGFCYERDMVHAGLPHVLYSLSAARWQPSS